MARGPGTAALRCGVPGVGFRPAACCRDAAIPPLSRRRNRPRLTDIPERSATTAAEAEHTDTTTGTPPAISAAAEPAAPEAAPPEAAEAGLVDAVTEAPAAPAPAPS